MPSQSDATFAAQLIGAHRSGAAIGHADAPADIASAMADQRHVAEALGGDVSGWKVAINATFGAVAAPLLSRLMRASPTSWPATPRLMIEVEVAVRLGRDLPPGAYSRHGVIDAIESMSVGVELVRPRLAAGAGAPFPAFLADNLGNDGYVIAARRLPWRELDLRTLGCFVAIDGVRFHDARCAHAQGDPLAPLIAYASAQNDMLGGLKAGQIVTTGSVCGVMPIARPCQFTAEIETLGTVEIAFT